MCSFILKVCVLYFSSFFFHFLFFKVCFFYFFKVCFSLFQKCVFFISKVFKSVCFFVFFKMRVFFILKMCFFFFTHIFNFKNNDRYFLKNVLTNLQNNCKKKNGGFSLLKNGGLKKNNGFLNFLKCKKPCTVLPKKLFFWGTVQMLVALEMTVCGGFFKSFCYTKI